MDIRFDDQVAIITGAGNGLGRSHALYLASRGAKVIVNDIGAAVDGTLLSERPAQVVAEEILSKGGQALPNFDNIAEPEGARHILEDALAKYGTVDILINNAGSLRDKTFSKMALEDFEFILKVHLMGAVYMTKAVFEIMKRKNFGRIVLTTSSAGLYGNFGQTNYGAAKMALVGFMNSLKLEAAKYNVLVNTVAPMAVTRMAEGTNIFPDYAADKLKPELVSAAVAYLCSSECRTSGNIISAGGGYYSGIRVFEGPGVVFGSERKVTPEDIAEKFGQITAAEGAIGFDSAKDQILEILNRIKG